MITPRVPIALRLLVWPAALLHALERAGWTEDPYIRIGTVAGVLLAAVATAVCVRMRDANPRADQVALWIELALTAVVVGITGSAASPWLVLYPWLLLDRWHRGPPLRFALAGVPVSYAVAILASDTGTLAISNTAPAAALYFLIATFAWRYGNASRYPSASRGTPVKKPRAGVEGNALSAAFTDLDSISRRLQPVTQRSGADPVHAVQAIATALRLIGRRSEPISGDLAYSRFSLPERVERAACGWAEVANRHEREIYVHFDTGLADGRFGDANRLDALLQLMLMAGCYRDGGDDIRLSVTRPDDAGDDPAHFNVAIDLEPDRAAGGLLTAVRESLSRLAHELGGYLETRDDPSRWTARLAIDCQDRPSARDDSRDGLEGIVVNVTGRSPLAPILSDYLRAEGATLAADPGSAEVTLLAVSSRTPEAEQKCQALRQRHPGIRLLCQGVTGGMPGGVMLEADGLLPMPLTRMDLVRVVREFAASRKSPRRAGSGPLASSPQPDREEPAAKTGNVVLVAEDDAISARVVTRFLEGEGVTVRRVNDGNEALRVLKQGGIDLALLDMHMPGLSGVEVAERLRAWEADRGIDATRLVALTASSADEDRRACTNAGMDDFLNKPVERDALKRLLAADNPR